MMICDTCGTNWPGAVHPAYKGIEYAYRCLEGRYGQGFAVAHTADGALIVRCPDCPIGGRLGNADALTAVRLAV